jgi:hypothetical protein
VSVDEGRRVSFRDDTVKLDGSRKRQQPHRPQVSAIAQYQQSDLPE